MAEPKCLAMRFHHVIFGALALLVLSACGDDGTSPAMDAHDADLGDEPFEPVECPDTLPEFRIGMTAMGVEQSIQGKLEDADKIPVGWYHNDWVVSFTGPNGEPLEDVEIIKARTWMPAHGHGGGQVPEIAPLDDGEFDVDGLNVTMGGVWQFIFEMAATNAEGDAITDTVTFYVCNSQAMPESD